MDEIRDIIKLIRFAMRAKSFKSFTRGQKVKTGAVGAGLLATLFGFFSGGAIPLEDFQLTPVHQAINASCVSAMDSRNMEFGNVYVSESCACTARQWASLSYTDTHEEFSETYNYMANFYQNYETEAYDENRMDSDLLRKYTLDGGGKNEISALRRSRMQQLVDVTNVCMNYDSFQGEAFTRMLSLPVKGESPYKDPQILDDGRVEIALRGDIQPLALAASN